MQQQGNNQFSPNHHPGRDVTPPRPSLPQNYTPQHRQQPMSPQQQHNQQQQQQHPQNGSFQDCVKSLSESFESGGGPDAKGAGGRRGSSESNASISSLASVPEPPHYTPSQNEDFPPPPPPLSGSPPGGAQATKQHGYNTSNAPMRDTDNPLSDVIEQLQGKPGTRGPQQQQQHQRSAAEWNNDSDGSDSDSGFESVNRKSGSSIGSTACPTGSTDTLPFANENVGTIKSRSQNSKPSIVTVSNGDGEEGERTVDVDSSFFEDSGTIKRRPKSDQQQLPAQQTSNVVRGQQGELS